MNRERKKVQIHFKGLCYLLLNILLHFVLFLCKSSVEQSVVVVSVAAEMIASS